MTTSHRPRHRRRRLALIILLTVVVVFIAATIVSWRWSTRPQGEPQAVEFATAQLSAPLLDARVLALGEATHGNADYQNLRLELSREVLPHGTRTIVMEEDYGTTSLVNDYIQGGEGTAEEAALRFGFRLNQTAENARWLEWLRDYNADLPAGGRVQLVGMDVQRVPASRSIALDGLAHHDPAAAERLGAVLSGLEDGEVTDAHATATRELVDATRTLPGSPHPHNAALALHHHVELMRTGDYSTVREEAMFDMLTRLVEQSTTPVLLFAHNGHVAKAEQGMLTQPVGAMAAETWGDDYQVIGTDFIDTEFLSGTPEERQAWTLHNRTPLAGVFAGTDVGYLDFADTSGKNRELVDTLITMGSAGERFTRLQQLIPLFHLVAGVPSEWYDALIVVDDATPTTMLG
ncbi:erythromycin esterase family protein [Corynebacterium suedekumii]|nr:erythromycin esterase family protein [Corynebacterium suedekumii]